jgi:hypothetical protein
MEYGFRFFYKEKEGAPHRAVTSEELYGLVGEQIAGRVISKARYRAESEEARNDPRLPQVKAFFERGGVQVIVADSTSRGDVYVELVEIEKRRDLGQIEDFPRVPKAEGETPGGIPEEDHRTAELRAAAV